MALKNGCMEVSRSWDHYIGLRTTEFSWVLNYAREYVNSRDNPDFTPGLGLQTSGLGFAGILTTGDVNISRGLLEQSVDGSARRNGCKT